MKIYKTITEIREELRQARSAGKRIGFVPTMGALHEGHLSLVRTLRKQCDISVCSIFINPTQFGDPKDYEMYQRNLPGDGEMLRREGVDILFAPEVSEIYGDGFQTSINVREVSNDFEGACRPGHFEGVATVVTILFNIVAPDVAIFGEKDYQQLTLIKRLVNDLRLPIEIITGELVRDHDGLALSSRNARLSPEGRRDALLISRGLADAVNLYHSGERASKVLKEAVIISINRMRNPVIDYVAVVDEHSLKPVERVSENGRILVVARVDGVRLLDTVGLGRRTPTTTCG
jgi:pantoate--beta-alanine ligase